MLKDIRPFVGIIAVLLPVISYAEQAESGPQRLPCRDPFPILRQSTFDLKVGPAHLRDGKDCITPFAGFPCQWGVELKRAEQWGTNPQFLLVVIDASHRGSGAWGSVFVYVCRGDNYVSVFSERFLYGPTVIEIGPKADFWLTTGVWEPRDPTCCPSSERRAHYQWNDREARFVVTESTIKVLKM